MTTELLTQELAHARLGYELLPHRRTSTAGEEASAIGVEPEEVAKTLVLATESGYVRAVLPASERLDLHKARGLLGVGHDARLATETELAGAYPMFELGAVPPFGGPTGDRTIVDRKVAGKDSVVLEAGSHTESVRMRTSDLIVLTHAVIADICAD